MAISWLTVLQSVPWSEVIGNAPRIARGAKQLWETFRKPTDPADASARAGSDAEGEAADLTGVEQRVASLEQSLGEMHVQLQSSADLIKSLADQNTFLVAQLEVMRRRQVGLIFAFALSVCVALPALVLAVRLYIT